MVNRPEVLAVVPARGGSKGLPRKNVRLLGGYPLLAYSVASGLAAKHVTRMIVSTDDEEIADVARRFGAEVPFCRPENLAADDTPDFPVFEHTLDWLSKHEDYRPDLVVQLRPTTPFRPIGLVDRAIELIRENPAADCVRGVTIPKQTPYKMWRQREDGYLLPLVETEFAEPYNMPRQKLPVAYWQTGHVDVIRTTTISKKHSLTGNKVLPVMVDADYCIDIDTLMDLESAARTVDQKQLNIDVPCALAEGSKRRTWPSQVSLVVFDFDGVFTDNRVMVFQDGREAVICNRGDGMGLSLLRKKGVPMIVLSTETHPVVRARCEKLQLECIHGLDDKAAALGRIAESRGIDLNQVVYVGNDVNDLECMKLAGFSVAVADAHPTATAQADFVLSHCGGVGAVREICDLLLQRI